MPPEQPRRRRGRPKKLITKKFADRAKRLGVAPPSMSSRLAAFAARTQQEVIRVLRDYRIDRTGEPPRRDPANADPDWPYIVPPTIMMMIRLDTRPQTETAADVGVGQGRISVWKRSRRVEAAMDRVIDQMARDRAAATQERRVPLAYQPWLDPVWD